MTSINFSADLQQKPVSPAADLQTQTLDLFYAYEVYFKSQAIAQLINTLEGIWTVFVGDNALYDGNYNDCFSYLHSRCNQYFEGITTQEVDGATVIYLQEMPIASILYEDIDFCTQPYVVKVSGEELHRASTWAGCYRYVQNQYQGAKFLARFLIHSA